MDKTHRQERLVELLREGLRSTDDLAKRLGVHPRTIRRDKNELIDRAVWQDEKELRDVARALTPLAWRKIADPMFIAQFDDNVERGVWAPEDHPNPRRLTQSALQRRDAMARDACREELRTAVNAAKRALRAEEADGHRMTPDAHEELGKLRELVDAWSARYAGVTWG